MSGSEYTPGTLKSPTWRQGPLLVALALAGLAHAGLLYFWPVSANLSQGSENGGVVSVSIQHLAPSPAGMPVDTSPEPQPTPRKPIPLAEATAEKHTPAPAAKTSELSKQPAGKPGPAPTAAPPSSQPAAVTAARQTEKPAAQTADPAAKHSPPVMPLSAQALSGRLPQYPPLAIRRQQEGTVEIRLRLTKAGDVESYELLKSSGHRLLDQAAIRFIERERFQPAQQNTQTVPSEQIFSFEFQLR